MITAFAGIIQRYMKKILLGLCLIAGVSSPWLSYARTETHRVNPQDIYSGYITQKVWLSAYAKPEVAILETTFENDVQLPKGAAVAAPTDIKVAIGMDRKQPFAVIYIPAFSKGNNGQINRLLSYSIDINEAPGVPGTPIKSAARTTNDVTSSVLASGSWYKVAVTRTGFYKIDNNFLSTLNPKPANASIASMRVYGNGGHMLSENNAVSRPSDLIENALLITDNGASAVFYAVGPTAWQVDTVSKLYSHIKNLYSDTAYYFITFDKGPGLRFADQPSVGAANTTVSAFDYHDVHDTDILNPAQLGKLWFGEGFYPQTGTLSQNFLFDIGTPVSDINCTVSFGHTSQQTQSSFDISVNGQHLGSATFQTCTVNGSDNVMALLVSRFNGPCNASTANVTVQFNPIDAATAGYLDYIEINARRSLTLSADQMSFRDIQSVGPGHIAAYEVQNANANTRVYDVTDAQHPVTMNGSLSGSTYTFSQDAGTLHEFAAFNGGAPYTPKFAGVVANQNLHATGPVDCIIVTYPDFVGPATRLGEYHQQHDNMRVKVATTTQIYNEFSSGAQDLSAIRDFARMFYQRAGGNTADMPKYMVLMGGASYDYKNRTPNNSNFVPVFESAESFNDLASFCSDDFYGFLDDSENIEDDGVINAMDIGVGRLPARSVNDATAMVDKIISYTAPATLGPWRIATTMVADNNDDAGPHTTVAEHMATAITDNTKGLYNINKVYVDATPTVSTPAGARCPNANAALNNDIYRGVFALNYNGHGNTQVWAGERILTQDDYNNWTNKNMLPFIITATCDYGQFDHPQYVSAAEQLVIRKGAGAIAMITTTQAVFSSYNESLNKQYLAAQFARNADGSWNSFGEASRIGKNATYTKPLNQHDPGETANFRKFGLLGDPALTPDFPKFNILIDSVSDAISMAPADTIKALGAYVLNGSVHDNEGKLMTDFNGITWVTFFDKPRTVNTIMGTNETFKLQDNVVYKGKATVTNGKFSVTFIAPKDINYYYGTGKISIYAHNGIIDAAGMDTSSKVGGYSDHPQLSNTPPIVRPYINDTLFRNGSITGTNTSLYVTLYSETGINVSGNSVGHDLTAVLDDNIETPYILNDYYETQPNTYKSGFVSFPVNGIPDGHHTITVKAWDVNNNVGEGKVDFVVVDGTVVDIQNLMTYPNPFSSLTHFAFEHNHPDEQMEVQIKVFNTGGAFVRDIRQTFTPSGSRSTELTWDGTDNNGQQLPAGVYIYRMNISTEKGVSSSAYQKLVIIR